MVALWTTLALKATASLSHPLTSHESSLMHSSMVQLESVAASVEMETEGCAVIRSSSVTSLFRNVMCEFSIYGRVWLC